MNYIAKRDGLTRYTRREVINASTPESHLIMMGERHGPFIVEEHCLTGITAPERKLVSEGDVMYVEYTYWGEEGPQPRLPGEMVTREVQSLLRWLRLHPEVSTIKVTPKEHERLLAHVPLTRVTPDKILPGSPCQEFLVACQRHVEVVIDRDIPEPGRGY